MSISISGAISSPFTNSGDSNPASVPADGATATAQSAPAATIEISAAAYQAFSTPPASGSGHGLNSLNIIWGSSPK